MQDRPYFTTQPRRKSEVRSVDLSCGKLALKMAPGMGRGVFATSDIPNGRLICNVATWELDKKSLKALEKTIISGFWFAPPGAGDSGLLAIGIVSLINHDEENNVAITWNRRTVGWIASLKATRLIKAGQQLFLDYGLPRDQLGF
jgi:hypothetical protein